MRKRAPRAAATSGRSKNVVVAPRNVGLPPEAGNAHTWTASMPLPEDADGSIAQPPTVKPESPVRVGTSRCPSVLGPGPVTVTVATAANVPLTVLRPAAASTYVPGGSVALSEKPLSANCGPKASPTSVLSSPYEATPTKNGGPAAG